MTDPACRWCRAPVKPPLPCGCDRAQSELARIRADSDLEVRRSLPLARLATVH